MPRVRFDLFSSGDLWAVLTEAGCPDLKSDRTLRDWIRNDSPPDSVRAFTAALLQMEKEAAPVSERLERVVIQLEKLASDLPLLAASLKAADDAERERDEQQNDGAQSDQAARGLGGE